MKVYLTDEFIAEVKILLRNKSYSDCEQAIISELFDIDRSVVSRHIKNFFRDDELDEKVVRAKFAHTTQHGALKGKEQTNLIDFYNLDIILAIGYRTNSSRAIKFRQ